MAFFLKQQGNRLDYNYKEYVVDKASDVTDLPVTGCPGSTAFVIATSDTYMLNTRQEWEKITK